MWNEAERSVSSAGRIASPALFLWAAQIALMTLLVQAEPRQTFTLSLVAVTSPLPVWMLLGLIDVVTPVTMLRVHVTLGAASLLLTGFAALLRSIPNDAGRRGAIAGLQILCTVALLRLGYGLWEWVSL
jgi:hypothetical protein